MKSIELPFPEQSFLFEKVPTLLPFYPYMEHIELLHPYIGHQKNPLEVEIAILLFSLQDFFHIFFHWELTLVSCCVG
ncbi:unnamed protein product [Schistosoma curassoni]|uniref:Ovule protein n=1 Tax=Schistosoma curassoni TaxID=6186 RepID=A0A183KBZ6_9TREM|nr:unnamed protein product [Schistosoma curassoni]